MRYLFWFTFAHTITVETLQKTAKPNCPTQCGNITVPYPFGNGTDCSLDDSFNLICNTSTEPPKLFLGGGNIDIYNISDSDLRIFNIVSNQCYNQSVRPAHGITSWITLQKHIGFTFSTKNKLTVISCDDYALITGTYGADISSGCFGICLKELDVANGECSGIG
ncbi:hypothetical protein L1987_37668 [Smallanthus sonchifolius]|uniref:Uncharacterized protein n=1 Tax=Smallanthus sonchifolius TaxID=185202 RepID=A0ACB9HIF7_9ASTR|nr:hypothetical protein L1987_37668 [Smallanthus sonchifolius]